jgi:hypothetical protein
MIEQHAGYVTGLVPLSPVHSRFLLLCLMHTSEVFLRVYSMDMEWMGTGTRAWALSTGTGTRQATHQTDKTGWREKGWRFSEMTLLCTCREAEPTHVGFTTRGSARRPINYIKKYDLA